MFFYSSKPLVSTVTQEEFNVFHQIDRILFMSLVINLNYEPVDATNIMALLLWVERYGYNSNLVADILKFPIQIIFFVTDECSMIWQCLETEIFPKNLEGDSGAIPLIQSLTKSGIDLHYFHENRQSILPSVMKRMEEVCVRAFSDIVFPSPNNGVLNNTSSETESRPVPLDIGENPSDVSTMNPMTRTVHPGNSSAGLGVMASQMVGVPQTVTPQSHGHHGFLYDRKDLNNEITEVVHPDDRTIFITFCIGYPVSELELRDFITRKFGNIIETMHMQDATATHPQPLYARVVVHSEKIIPVVLGGFLKVKFTINGKHVWARKYKAVKASKYTEEASTSK